MQPISTITLVSFLVLSGCARPSDDSSASSDGTQTNGSCPAKNSKQIEVPLIPGQANSGTFQYHYQHLVTAAAGQPTFIYFPGGPGGSSMDFALPKLPSGVGQINVDIRGIGCNESQQFEEAHLRSQLFAADIISVIKAEKLQNYIFLGQSYGTMLATITAGMIENEAAIPKPKALVLDGVLGRSFDGPETLATYKDLWRQTQGSLSQELKQKFASSSLPLNYSANEWGQIIPNLLSAGTNVDGDYAPYFLQYLSKMSESEGRDFFGQFISPPAPPSVSRVFEVIACQEISQETRGMDGDFVFSNGELMEKPRICKRSFSDEKFDSAKWQTSAKIYYIQGEQDPSTPVWQARYHNDNQTKASSKSLSVVPGGGHCILGDMLLNCLETMWPKIMSGEDLQSTIQSCNRPKP